MVRICKGRQAGMTLIEVLIALLILVITLFGAGAVQLNALKYTASALKSTQASFIGYSMLDRMRANSTGDYRISGLGQIRPAATDVINQDLNEFKRSIHQFAGDSARAAIALNGGQVSITLQWDDVRSVGKPGALGVFSLSSNLVADTAAKAS